MIFTCFKCGDFDDADELVFTTEGPPEAAVGVLFASKHSCGSHLVYNIIAEGV